MQTGDRPVIVAIDLDRTLIHAASSAAGRHDVVVVEELDGLPLSVMTVAAAELYGRLCARCTVVPATTRSLAQYRRVRLPSAPRWAIAANGGTVLRDGEAHAAWRAELPRRVDAALLPQARVVMDGAAVRSQGAIARVTPRDELFLSALITAAVHPGVLAAADAELAAIGWRLASSGRKLYALPEGLDKERALAWIAGQIGEPVIAAAGDSSLDTGLLRMAGAALCPRDAEAIDLLDPSTVWVTPRRGLSATEDLLERAMAIVCGEPVVGR